MNLASCMKVAANQLNIIMNDSDLESSSIDQIVNIECDFRTKYSNINFFYLLESNVQSQEGLLQLSSALHILIKYGCNLVRPVPLRPFGWQRILFSNRIFKERVDIIKGSQNILQKLGYKKESKDGLSYEEPEDPSQVPMIVVELMGSRSEIEKYLNREHPFPYLIDNILKSNMIDSNESKHTQCDICGGDATLFCDRCEDKPLCESCEKRWHSHSQRKFHKCRSLQQRKRDCEEFTELSNQLSTKKDMMAKLISEVPVIPFNSIQGNQIWNGARPKSPALKTDENRKPSNNFLSDSPGGGDVNQTSKSKSRKEFHASTPKKLNGENWKWVCDHCTFINSCATETTKKICDSCCRTSDYPMTYLEHRSDDKSDEEFHDCSEEFSFDGDSRRKSSIESGKYSSNEKSNSSIYSIDREPFKSRILDEYDEIEHEKREAKALFEANEEISVKSLDSTRSPNCLSSAEPTRSSLEQTWLSDEHEPKRRSTSVEMERLRCEGYFVIEALKEAERRGFDDDEFSCILHMSKDTLPLEFIKNQWTANIAKVREDLVKQNVLYVEWMTDQFIRSSLTSCDGDVEKAAVVCRERWKEKLESLMPSGDCSAGLEEAVAYLVQYNGDFEMARDCLIRDTFLERIWNSDEHSLTYDEDDIYQMPRRRLDENLIQRLKDDSIHYEARVRSILVEADLMGWQRAENVIALLHDSSFEGEITLMDVVDAVGTYGNLDRCIQYLQQECPICFRKFPHREIQTLACCSCTMCRECIKQHFDIAIREKHVRDFICPLCQMPDIDTIENAEQTHLHFQFLYMLIEHEKREAKALFEANEEMSVKSLDSTRSPNCLSSAEPTRSSLEQTRLSDEHEPKHRSTSVEMERLRCEGYSVIEALKEAERRGFDDDEFSCILQMSKDTLPLEFIKNQWTANIAKVREDLVKQNVLYVEWMTDQFIRSSLTSCDGDVKKAAVVCRERWKEKLESLMPSGDCSAGLEEAVAYLVQYNGDFEMARDCLIRDTFLERIWNSDEHSLTYDEDDIYQMPRRRLDENLIQRLKDDSIHYEARVRSILVEADLMGWQRAENVIALLHDSSFEGEIALMDVVDAVGTYGNLDRCIQYLQQECPICFRKFPHREIQTLACCSCTMCRECIKQHFDIAIREKHVRDFICPLCQMPDIDTIENAEQTHLHFQFLYMLLKPPFLSDETHAIFQQKLCEWNLKMQPGFIWCAFDDCQNGFLVENANQNKVACTQCHRYMCKDCRKEWADQHKGITCEAFEEWTRNNDPEYQNQGLARHLDEHGIECPQCRSPYSLSKGGCMHFKCLQCRHEFCEGCYQPMKRENTCQLYVGCARMGMHCHHPRDCLYYLRDNSVAQLQQLLQGRGITTYDTLDPSVEHQDGCRIMIQNVGATTKDEPCGKPTPQNYAGLCECHYKEYLVALINRNNIDPLPIMTSEDMMQVLRRAELPIPIKMNNESDEQYCDKLKETILNRIPLPERKKKGTRNIV